MNEEWFVEGDGFGKVPYYTAEQQRNYDRIAALGLDQWNDLFTEPGTWTCDRFQNRAFLEAVLPHLDLPQPAETSVFEYGCGTGPAACFLAARGFRVEAVDLIPTAIDIARRHALDRGLDATFAVADIVALADVPAPRQFDIVLDSFVLQSIVTDRDRDMLFAAVRDRLKPNGYYIVSSALRSPDATDVPGERYDPSTGILAIEVDEASVPEQSFQVDGRWYAPHRRHFAPEGLRADVAAHGFRVLDIAGPDPGDVVCQVASTAAA